MPGHVITVLLMLAQSKNPYALLSFTAAASALPMTRLLRRDSLPACTSSMTADNPKLPIVLSRLLVVHADARTSALTSLGSLYY